MSDFRVGDVLTVVLDGIRRSDAVTVKELPVTKVGRKWVTVGTGWEAMRFDAETMTLDGKSFSSPGAVYYSREEYERSTELGKAWDKFTKQLYRLPHSAPDGWTIERIAKAREILGLEP